MSSTTFEPSPVLVSDLPPVAVPAPRRRGLVRARLGAARDRRALARAFRSASPNELVDLMAQARRS